MVTINKSNFFNRIKKNIKMAIIIILIYLEFKSKDKNKELQLIIIFNSKIIENHLTHIPKDREHLAKRIKINYLKNSKRNKTVRHFITITIVIIFHGHY
jgi:hypothetical protein